MTQEIDRVYRLTAIRTPSIDDIEGFDRSFFEEQEVLTTITEHRIEFKVEKHLGKQPNVMEATLYNLAPATRDELVAHEPIKIRFEAGYDDTPRLLFLGDLRFASHEIDGTEWKTKLQIGDGARAYAEARVSNAFAPGTSLATILARIAKSFGVTLPPLSSELRQQVAAGEVLSGYASDELTRLIAPYGFEWSFQGGRLQILRTDQALSGTVRVLNQDSGMIGAPVIDPPKIRAPSKAARSKAKPKVPKVTVKHLLYPEVTPGERDMVESRSLNLTFRVDTVTHEGDNYGGAWTSTIEGAEV